MNLGKETLKELSENIFTAGYRGLNNKGPPVFSYPDRYLGRFLLASKNCAELCSIVSYSASLNLSYGAFCY